MTGPRKPRYRRHAASLLLAACTGTGCVALFPGTAHAYLDPGTSSMLLSAVIGIAATMFFMAKTFYYKAAALFYRLTGAAAPPHAKDALVFYSEGRQYWNTFKPVLEALDALGKKALYLTSGEDDPGLSHPFAHVETRFIGTGNRAFAAMNMLEAGVCVTTTPGLDVLQIRRSPGVKHYAHLVHSPTDMAIYRPYSFDWFDSVLCAGPHQARSLRYLEELRNTPEKALFHTGCAYMDVLADELERSGVAPLPYPWELAKLPELGASIKPEDVRKLPDILAVLPGRQEFAARMRRLRAESLFNYRSVGRVAAEQILEIREKILEN